jgi:hypothetical protein
VRHRFNVIENELCDFSRNDSFSQDNTV